jgi:hypothetical protein
LAAAAAVLPLQVMHLQVEGEEVNFLQGVALLLADLEWY